MRDVIITSLQGLSDRPFATFMTSAMQESSSVAPALRRCGSFL